MSKNTRNYGIDLLRIFLMFMIVVGHLFTHTEVRESVALESFQGFVTWGVQSLTVCAVNCFALITGYFESTKKKINVRRIIELWGLCIFYSLGIYAIFLACGATDFSVFDLLRYATPMLSQVYWFFSAYIILSLFAPFINKMLEQLNDRMFKYLLILIVVLFYVLPILSIVFPQLDQSEGMSAFALGTLYVIGAALRRFEINIKKRFCVIGLLVNNAIVLLSKYILDWVVRAMNMSVGTGLFYHNNTIFQLCNAILLFLLFKQLSISNPKLSKPIAFVSASAFSIYLIHEHPLLRSFIWSSQMKEHLLQAQWYEYFGLIFAIPLVVFVICLLIDAVRKLLFFVAGKNNQIAKVKEKIIHCEARINSSFSRDDNDAM